MIDTMVNTKNVRAFHAGLEVLGKGVKGRRGLMTVSGPPGTGKTLTCQQTAVETDGVYIRCNFVDTPRSLLKAVVEELGGEGRGYTGKLFEQAKEQLVSNPRTIIFDEADYLTDGKGIIEIVRDLNDATNSPMIISGMEHLDKKLQRFPHLVDRICAAVHFQLFNRAEIEKLAGQLCEVVLEAETLDYIHVQGGGKLRVTMAMFELAERTAKLNKLQSVTMDCIKPSWEKEKKRTRS